MRCLRTLVALVVAASLLAPAGASASAGGDFLAVYKVYKRSGVVDGCTFSAQKLASAKQGVPPDIDTYAPDFPDALDAALERRTSGACAKKAAAAKPAAVTPAGAAPIAAKTAAPGAVTPPAAAGGAAAGAPPAAAAEATAATGPTGAAPTTTPAPAPEAAASPAAADDAVAAAAARDTGGTDGAPLPLLVLAAALVVALVVALLWALARFFGWDPRWLVSTRHASAEAGWRASASWAEFTDWMRFGR
jgi:hypothetical protein